LWIWPLAAAIPTFAASNGVLSAGTLALQQPGRVGRT
jgi:hypothetical protein